MEYLINVINCWYDKYHDCSAGQNNHIRLRSLTSYLWVYVVSNILKKFHKTPNLLRVFIDTYTLHRHTVSLTLDALPDKSFFRAYDFWQLKIYELKFSMNDKQSKPNTWRRRRISFHMNLPYEAIHLHL